MDDINISLGQKIRGFRKNNTDLSQLKFATEIGLNHNYYSDIENGRRNPTVDVLYKISKGLGVSLGDLFLGIDAKKSKEEVAIMNDIIVLLSGLKQKDLKLSLKVLTDVSGWVKEK